MPLTCKFMNNKLKENRPILFFSLAWFLVNLVQAYFTEVHADEAYYWVYSLFPAWGYFDHPPVIAILIKLGYSLFANELGTRIFPALLGAGTVYIVYQLLPQGKRDIRLYILVVSAVSLMHLNVAGFMALPDIPLVFFASLFYLVLKRYLVEDRMIQALALGLIIALMMYSKYHALLVIFFTILSDWRLILRRTFWVIVAVSLVLYLPHILWQVQNNFVSFEYHLVYRNDPFQPRQILEFIGNQLLVTGPFVGFLLLYLAFSRRAGDAFERMMKFNLVGFFGFFLISSFRGHVEPQWTAAAFPPMIVLALIQADGFRKLKRWLVILGFATIPVILVMRLFLMVEFLPLPSHISNMIHQQDTWARQIEEVAGDRPVVFRNKFQYPSLYWFYTQKTAFTRNSIYYRRNQYDVWDLEHELQGKQVFLAGYGWDPEIDTLQTIYGETYYYEIDKYCSYNNIKIRIQESPESIIQGDSLQLSIRIENPNDYPVCLDCPCDMPPTLVAVFRNQEGKFSYSRQMDPPEVSVLEPGNTVDYAIKVRVPEIPGPYQLMVSFRSKYLNPGINGKPVRIEVAPPADPA